MNLPNVFQNRKLSIKENGQDLFYGNSTPTPERKQDYKDIKTKIKELFSSKRYIYKVDCMIETKTKKNKDFSCWSNK